MVTQEDVTKAKEDYWAGKISFDEYDRISDAYHKQMPRSTFSSQDSRNRESYSYRPRGEYGATSAPVSQATLAAVQSSRPFRNNSHRDSTPKKQVVYVSPTNYDGSLFVREQPNHENGHVRSVWELKAGQEYCVMKTDEKGTRQIGNAVIKGKPREKPFKAEFYPIQGGSYETHIDPVQYGLLPNGRGLWNASFWLATI